MATIDDLLDVMRRLRDPLDGCPWDLGQTFDSIAPYTIEEAYEVADAITREDFDELPIELGDLLFQVVFHAQMAQEKGLFDFNTVVEAIVEKMMRRHPHVFGDDTTRNAEDLSKAWDQHKQTELSAKGRATGLMDQVPPGLPAITRALKLQKKAARVGFDWLEASSVVPKITEEIGELSSAMDSGDPSAIEAELGDVLFSCVNLARHLGVDPERALRRVNLRFEQRFREMEAIAGERGTTLRDLSSPELEDLWCAAKCVLER